VKSFVDTDLLPYVRGLREKPGATPRQKVISEIMSGDLIEAKGREVAEAIASLRRMLQ